MTRLIASMLWRSAMDAVREQKLSPTLPHTRGIHILSKIVWNR